MKDKRQDKTGTDPKAERLKAALKANIARRKAQAKARDAQGQEGPQRVPDEE